MIEIKILALAIFLVAGIIYWVVGEILYTLVNFIRKLEYERAGLFYKKPHSDIYF